MREFKSLKQVAYDLFIQIIMYLVLVMVVGEYTH